MQQAHEHKLDDLMSSPKEVLDRIKEVEAALKEYRSEIASHPDDENVGAWKEQAHRLELRLAKLKDKAATSEE